MIWVAYDGCVGGVYRRSVLHYDVLSERRRSARYEGCCDKGRALLELLICNYSNY